MPTVRWGTLGARWRRWKARGGDPDDVVDVALWPVPFGIAGGRIYHVLTDPELYFLPGRNPVQAFYIWDGGLGIWGRWRLARWGPGSDAGVGGPTCWTSATRWPQDWCWPKRSDAGTLLRPELYGRPTTLPWALQIDPAHRPVDTPTIGLYHPTFLYESLWDIAVAVLLLWVARRFTLPRGKLFALYVAAYTLGRGAVEALRVDHANHILGLRLNDWTSLIVFLAAVAVLCWGRAPSQRNVDVDIAQPR